MRRILSAVSVAAVAFAPVSAQDVRLTAEDAAIIRAAIDGVVRPEIARLERRDASAALPIFDRTIAICPGDGSHPREMGCLDDAPSGRLSRLSTAFKNDLQDPVRAEIRTSFLQRNKSNVMIPPEAITGVVVATPAEIAARFDANTGRGALHATLSMPGKSADGRAIVYASYWCGNLCAYGWLVLLQKTTDGWRVVAKELLWIS